MARLCSPKRASKPVYRPGLPVAGRRRTNAAGTPSGLHGPRFGISRQGDEPDTGHPSFLLDSDK
jgi:hypothetical protein